jgi:hypothetical protein
LYSQPFSWQVICSQRSSLPTNRATFMRANPALMVRGAGMSKLSRPALIAAISAACFVMKASALNVMAFDLLYAQKPSIRAGSGEAAVRCYSLMR